MPALYPASSVFNHFPPSVTADRSRVCIFVVESVPSALCEVCPVDVGSHGGEEHGEKVGSPAALLLLSRRARRRRGGPAFGTCVLIAHAVVLQGKILAEESNSIEGTVQIGYMVHGFTPKIDPI